jgi:hypothetical protein
MSQRHELVANLQNGTSTTRGGGDGEGLNEEIRDELTRTTVPAFGSIRSRSAGGHSRPSGMAYRTCLQTSPTEGKGLVVTVLVQSPVGGHLLQA